MCDAALTTVIIVLVSPGVTTAALLGPAGWSGGSAMRSSAISGTRMEP
jgi:hypothetical protein